MPTGCNRWAKTKEINHLSDTETTSVTADVAMLESLDPASREVAVTSMLDQARQWLERAKESTTPAQDVAEFKAFVATVAEAAKQKKLSEAIQLDALEMVRRSERALGVAIRAGQAAGEVRVQYKNTGPKEDYMRGDTVVRIDRDSHETSISPTQFFNSTGERAGSYAMADEATDEQFEDALEAAREEGNLSRNNVVAKVKELSSFRETHDEKWAKVADMAGRGNTSSQIAREVGMSEEGLRSASRKKGIEFPADKLTNYKRIDPLYVIEQIVLGLEVTETSLELVSYENVTPEQAAEWLQRLGKSLRAIRKMQNELKEIR